MADCGLARRAMLVAVVTGALALTGCKSTQVDGDLRQRIQSRAERQFNRVSMAKPDEAAAQAFPLAPLILVERTETTGGLPLPTDVWTWTNTARWGGEPVKQVLFAWQTVSGAQGICMTLNAQGMPVLWEVLRDRTGMRVFYVGQSVEAEAMRQHKQPLAGQRFWVAPDPADGRVIIARVLEETTVPMGPIVYLEASTGDVGTVICRCMPAQAREVIGTRFYRVHTVPAGDWRILPSDLRRQLRRWKPEGAPEDMTSRFRIGRGY